MASTIIVSYRNVLETGTVTVTSENTSFPKERLFDRDIGLLFKGNSTPANFYITLNQDVTVYEVNRLIIPANHNLDGLTIKLEYSTDNFSGDINDAVTPWVQSGSGQIDKSFTAQTKQYWRLNIASPASAPELHEMYLTKDVSFAHNPLYGSMIGTRRNILTDQTQSGITRKVKLGELRKIRTYSMNVGNTQKSDFESWEAHCEGVKSFYIHDYDDACVFMEMLNDLEFIASSPNRWTCTLELMEVLG